MTEPSLIEDFADEAREHLEELEHNLLQLASDPAGRDLLDGIFRSMHTIKGASEYLGFERIARLSHCLENLLDVFRDGRLRADRVAVDLLIDARDRIEELVGQIETTGRESSEIEDLLDRAGSIAAGKAESETESGSAEVSPGEVDRELFTIFIEQLTEGLVRLAETAGRLSVGPDMDARIGRMADQVKRLGGTARYMGFDALSAVYDDLLSGIDMVAGLSPDADSTKMTGSLRATIVDGIGRIRKLFPHQEGLAAIDLSELTGVVDGDEPSPSRPAAIEAGSSEIDRLLSGLPNLDGQDRESLLSNTLDETFAAMQVDGRQPGGSPGTAGEGDAMVMMAPREQGGSDVSRPIRATTVDPVKGLSRILDDFGADRHDGRGATDDSCVNGAANRLAGEGAGMVPLWPMAVESNDSTPIVTVDATPVVVPKPDFSLPPDPRPAPAEATRDETVSTPKAIRKSIRVDAGKIDDLMNQVGELVVNRSSFQQLFDELRDLTRYLNHRFPLDKADQGRVAGLTTRLNDATTALGRVTGGLQEQVMKVRMLPIAHLFNRYSRLVHDLLKDTDKKIQLQLRGEETELDRMVIEQLADPMIHIIRNAVDHGIEIRGERERKGKPPSGLLLLEAYHEGSHVVIEVTDDGKGLDFSCIRQKALDKQLADRETLAQMDPPALIEMIMQPGFSTTDQVTHTSGRGVGMDVVKRNIEKINGSLTVDTRPDVGTRIRIRIPLTLAIIPALMIRCGASHFSVPLSAVQETIRVDPGEIFTVDGGDVMHLHTEPLPLIKLTDLLHMPGIPSLGVDGRLYVVVVNAASGRTGFVVDALLGRQEVVVKPLEAYLQESSGFSGATILGDGAISLILNVEELVAMAQQRKVERKLAAAVL